jgi:uncharacterized membrane protein YeaQ/YmgE (transglycosylase-associated protein family)
MEDGGTYVGTTKDGVPHGQGTYTWTSGEKYVGKWKDGKQHGQGTHTDGLMPKENKISVSKESFGKGASNLGNIVAIFFGIGGATTGMYLGSSTYGFSWLTIVGAIIGFLIVYYFWKLVFWVIKDIISKFFN